MNLFDILESKSINFGSYAIPSSYLLHSTHYLAYTLDWNIYVPLIFGHTVSHLLFGFSLLWMLWMIAGELKYVNWVGAVLLACIPGFANFGGYNNIEACLGGAFATFSLTLTYHALKTETQTWLRSAILGGIALLAAIATRYEYMYIAPASAVALIVGGLLLFDSGTRKKVFALATINATADAGAMYMYSYLVAIAARSAIPPKIADRSQV